MFFQELLAFLTKYFNNAEKKEMKVLEVQKVNSLELLASLYEVIQDNLIPFNLPEFIRTRSNVEFSSLVGGRGQLRFSKSSKHQQAIETVLRVLPGAHVSNEWRNIEEIWIEFDLDKYKRGILASNHLMYDTSVNLKSLLDFLKQNKNPLFDNILSKYEDTFFNLDSTIKEMLASGGVPSSSQLTIKRTLDAIINEFLSLKIQLDTKKKLDEEAIAKSLEQRIEDEFTLVDIIKTNWSN